MPYSNPLLSILSFGAANAGLTLYGQFCDISGVNTGSQINSGFFEIGQGDYGFFCDTIPYLFRGAIKFYNSTSSQYIASESINPEEVFLPDLITSQHGSGNYNYNGQVNGRNVVTVEITDQLSDIIGDSRVEVRPSGNLTITALGYTNTNTGQVIFNLDNGPYAFTVTKPQYAYFDNPFYINISGDTSETFQGNNFTITGPSNMSTVRVYTYLDDIGLNEQTSVQMSIGPSGSVAFNNQNLLLKQPITAISDNTGFVYIDVASNSGPFVVKIPSCGFTRYFHTPASGFLNIASLE